MRGVLSAISVFEAIILGLAIPVALAYTDLPAGTVAITGGALALVSLLNAGLVRRDLGVWIGSALQLVLIGLGFVVAQLFLLGMVFGGLWVWALFAERRLERLKRREAEATGASADTGSGRAADAVDSPTVPAGSDG